MPPLFVSINLWAVGCLLIGMALVTVEIFTPGFGLAGGSGLLFMAIAILLQANSLLEAVILAAGMLLVLGIVFAIAMRSATKGRLFRSPVILKDVIGSEREYSQQKNLVGSRGYTTTPLRPAGTAEFNGMRMTVVTRGEYLPADTRVEIAGTDGVTPIVKESNEEE